MKKFIVFIAMTALISGSLNTVFAKETTQQPLKNNGWNHGNKHGYDHGKKLGLMKQLNLTEEQDAKAKELRTQSREKIKPFIDQIKIEKVKMKEMIEQSASKEELAKQKEKIADLMKQTKVIHKQNLASFEEILTSEQKTKFKEIKKKKIERNKEKRGKKLNHRQN
ncbi:MAG: Spy/CpxP family protein refolding chaperone [Candidatus Gastranaerophilales bacterium]|nr:Spy/CpxP family protein refolding chaperone [Candidatus Gastranaerophilales bacterium]